MSDNLMEKVSAFGERLKIGGAEVSRKMSEGVSQMSFKMKELFQGPNPADKLVEDATSETLEEPDWAMNLDLCDMINSEKINSVELIRGIKKRIMLKNPRVQYLALVLLETCVKNCEKAFSEVAAERVLDEMVKLIDDPQTVVNNRNKALMLIESWGESTGELRYLPVYEETYKSLRSRGIRFPGRDNESLAPIFTPARSAPEVDATLAQQMQHDIPVQSFILFTPTRCFTGILVISLILAVGQDDLTTTLVQQCRQSQFTVLRIIETSGDNEPLLFEALNVNDEIQKPVEADESPRHTKEDALIRKPAGSRGGSHGASNDDMMDDLDEMIFGKKGGGGASEGGHDSKKQQNPKDDLISF
ncbi:hypothetical protein Pint_21060 [Pistacia integerrima]|uniref:Uncharacterized protein n=1 Tax=Pistacia integerrima TaxID=434235 RepID=A0ACC0XCP0_9ROSI|nr:hypothetical protein Pint_21060 [Pistacia integerrima]